jgi:PEP-CTERM motif
LEWSLTVDQFSAPNSLNGVLYDYMATLTVQDDPTIDTNPTSYVISAVDFKVSGAKATGADLFSVPLSSSAWTTGINGLSAGGCTNNSNPGFVCSQTSSDPANFTSFDTVSWIWYFNASGIIGPDMIGDHIGAKLTDLSNRGKLLSASYTVPEPGTLTLLTLGIAGALVTRARRRHGNVTL